MKCYDTLTNEYKDVEVCKELETEIKRSYWREDKSEQRYKARVTEFIDGVLVKKSQDVLDMVILNDEISILRDCIMRLPKRSKLVIYYKYFLNLNNVEISKILGVSNSYIGRLIKSIKLKLKEDMLSRYDYYV